MTPLVNGVTDTHFNMEFPPLLLSWLYKFTCYFISSESG